MELNVFGFGRKKPKEEQPTQVLEGESCKSYVIELMKEYFSALDHFQFIGATAVLKDKKVLFDSLIPRSLAHSLFWLQLIFNKESCHCHALGISSHAIIDADILRRYLLFSSFYGTQTTKTRGNKRTSIPFSQFIFLVHANRH